MPLTRSILKRAAEGVHTALTTHTALTNIIPASKILIGPYGGDDMTVVPQQIGVAPVPLPRFVPGMAGSQTMEFSIAVVLFDYYSHEAVAAGGTDDGWDIIEECEKRIFAGGNDPDQATEPMGRILDPDNPSGQGTLKYVNLGITSFDRGSLRIFPGRAEPGKAVALVYSTIVNMVTRIDNLTRQRV